MSDVATPRALGYRMPAEWEPHRATWLAWPHNRQTWPEAFPVMARVWAELVRQIAGREPVHVLAGGGAVMAEARDLVGDVPGVVVHPIATNDAWIRDHGPTFLAGPADQPPALVDWDYNAWGGKYPPFDLDQAVAAAIAAVTGRRRFCPGVVLEGGAVDSNGRGTLLASEGSLLNPNRNPGVSRARMEACLRDYLGATHVIWIDAPIAGDDTDGHLDQVARFVGPSTVVASRETDPDDANYAALESNFRRLQETTDQAGRPLEVIPLPMPRPVRGRGGRLPASYANFYLANGLVVVPQFDDPADGEAARILADLFPGRQVVGLPARQLVEGLGGYHCITQQEPA